MTIGDSVYASEKPSTKESKDEIIADYRKALNDINFNAGTNKSPASTQDVIDTKNEIQTNTVKRLVNAGYEAYDVNPETFSDVEDKLQTNLKEAGINPEYSYIILIEGEDDKNSMLRSSTSASFSHTYNSKTYKLRWLTMYATDDPLMGKASNVNVLSSTSKSLLVNCLNTVISSYVSSVRKEFGTVASICGLDITDFAPDQKTTMLLNAGTNWTRYYAQVWSDYDNIWLYGSCVEKASLYSYMSGTYYKASTNRYTKVAENEVYDTRYSPKYNDLQWRKDAAVVGFLNSWIQWDSVGDVSYQYNGETKITHIHNF